MVPTLGWHFAGAGWNNVRHYFFGDTALCGLIASAEPGLDSDPDAPDVEPARTAGGLDTFASAPGDCRQCRHVLAARDKARRASGRLLEWQIEMDRTVRNFEQFHQAAGGTGNA